MIVVLAVTEKQVILTDQFNTQPITGRMAIFQKVQAPTETRVDVEIVGVYTDHDTAMLAGQAHAAQHPGRRYITKVCVLDDKVPGPAETPKCIKCGVENPTGQSFCAKCNAIHLAECAALDTQPDAPNPVIKTTFGQPLTPYEPPRLLNGQPA